MPYTKKEYDDMVKIHMPIDDPYETGQKPKLQNEINKIIEKARTIEYLCEEVRGQLEILKEGLYKL